MVVVINEETTRVAISRVAIDCATRHLQPTHTGQANTQWHWKDSLGLLVNTYTLSRVTIDPSGLVSSYNEGKVASPSFQAEGNASGKMDISGGGHSTRSSCVTKLRNDCRCFEVCTSFEVETQLPKQLLSVAVGRSKLWFDRDAYALKSAVPLKP